MEDTLLDYHPFGQCKGFDRVTEKRLFLHSRRISFVLVTILPSSNLGFYEM